MIVYPGGHDTVKTTDVLYSQKAAIRSLAISMIINCAEGTRDMIIDCSEEYSTKADIEIMFRSIHEQARDMLEDHIHDLQVALDQALRDIKFTARVHRLDYDKEGQLSDIGVDITVE